VTLAVQPALDIWGELAEGRVPDHERRIVAVSTDRLTWLKARARGVTSTDAARMSSVKSLDQVAMDKVLGRSFRGNAYTDHGRVREPEIAKWVLREHGIPSSQVLFHAAHDPLHLATPDGVRVAGSRVELAEIKTTTSAWKSIPRHYLRQVFWQQYVLGADRTLVVWEQHREFVPIGAEPLCRWVDRDDDEIHVLVEYANRVLRLMRRR
jgi:hypothetical protein